MAANHPSNLSRPTSNGPFNTPSSESRYVKDSDNRPEANMSNVSHLTGARPTVAYSWRAPSPPHIYVPQPREDQKLSLPAFKALGYTPEETEILNSMTSQNQWIDKAKEWRYHLRREAQTIVTFLQLGPSNAAKNLDALRKDGVTMLLAIRSTLSAQASLLNGDKAARELGIESAHIDVAGNGELIAAFPRAFRIINDHLILQYREWNATSGARPESPNAKVLVFCESGNERSAAFVTAYLMNTYGLEHIPALQYVQSQRFCVAFDDNIKNMIKAYDDILVAQRQLSQDPPSAPTLKIKRSRADIDSDDVDMDMGNRDDEERFSGRAAFVPFQG